MLAVANILLEYTDDGAGKAERLLDATLEESKAATDEWKASAHALVAYALAAQGRIEDAQRQLENVAGAGTASLQALVEGLDRLCATAQPALKNNLATLELHALALIKDARPKQAPNNSVSSPWRERRRWSRPVARSRQPPNYDNWPPTVRATDAFRALALALWKQRTQAAPGRLAKHRG